MSLLLGGYRLSYVDQSTGERVEIPLDDAEVVLPQVSHGAGAVIIYDESADVTPEMLERPKAYAEARELRRVALLDVGLDVIEAKAVAYAKDHPEMLEPLEATFEITRFDERAFKRSFLSDFPVEKRRPKVNDWHDRRKQHRNRKRRAWR